MPDFDVSKWPPLYQLFALIGAAVAGAGVWLVGSRGGGSAAQTTDRTQAKLDTAELRLDIEDVLRANREAFHVRIKEISDEHKEELAALEIRVRRLEVDVAVLQQRKPSR